MSFISLLLADGVASTGLGFGAGFGGGIGAGLVIGIILGVNFFKNRLRNKLGLELDAENISITGKDGKSISREEFLSLLSESKTK